MANCKRVAILGAGCSGLTAMKCCVDEGLEPVCFERTDEIGGLWRYTEKVEDDQACVMKSTMINSCKETMCYSDFPIPKEYPNFMHNTMVWEYFREYAKHFQLNRYINYNTEVKKVCRASDYQTTGRWTIQVEDHQSGEVSTEDFDAVMVCSGHHADKNVPSFPGLGGFQGKVIHSHDYREPSGYEGKRVVVIGSGDSGCDVAVELSRLGQVYLSTRSGAWILHRLGPHGIPSDLHNNRRSTQLFLNLLPASLRGWMLSRQLNQRLDHDLYGLRSRHAPYVQQPTISDDLGNRIACGSVKVKPDVKRFTATGVEFADGTFEDNIDVVVLATGFIFGFPFLDQSVLEVKENKLPFYKYMFHPDLPHPTLAIIGCVQPCGSVMPISELQSRLATRVFKGDVKLPSPSQMWKDILAKTKDECCSLLSAQSLRYSIRVEWVRFMDELADLIGCKPDFLSLLTSDPVLAFHVLCGPCTPCQYRLQGPGQWKGARHAVMTTMDRVRYPLSTRPLPPSTPQALHFVLWGLALLVILGIVWAIV